MALQASNSGEIVAPEDQTEEILVLLLLSPARTFPHALHDLVGVIV